VRTVIAAMNDDTPERLVLGSAAYDRVVAKLDGVLAEVRANETSSRGADFPPRA
jgi:hypothetical protein